LQTQPPNAVAVLKWAFFAAILIITGVGFFLGPQLEPSLEDDMRYVIGGILLLVAVSSFLLTRYLVLPGMARQQAQPSAIASTAYGFAETPAIFGLGLAIMTAEGWVALPFGALALLSWVVMRNYVAGVQAEEPEDFPRL
jgi:hypothetical protein